MKGGRKVRESSGRAFAAFALCAALACAAAFFAFMPDLQFGALPESRLSAFAEVRLDPPGDGSSVGVEELSDFSPLFLPTRWNYGRRRPYSPAPESPAEPAAARPAYAEALEDSSLVLGKNELEAARTGLFRSIMRSVFSSFGRKDSAEQPAARKNALIKVVDMSSGRTVRSEYADARAAEIMISPAEFLVDVFDGGLAGRPLLLKSSGSEESDSEIAEVIAGKAVLRGLGSGQYKVVFTF